MILSSKSSQSGGIFFYILLGVVLFAALGYALSRNRISTNPVGDDKAKLYAAEIISYGNQLLAAVSKLKLRGCKENQFDFTNNVYMFVNGTASMPSNTSAPSDGSCGIYSTSGAGLIPYIPPADALGSNSISGATPKYGNGSVAVSQVAQIGTDGVSGTASANELNFVLYWLNKKTCLAINASLGIAAVSGDAPTGTVSGSDGTYANGSFSGTGIYSGTLTGLRSVCRKTGTDQYVYTQALLFR